MSNFRFSILYPCLPITGTSFWILKKILPPMSMFSLHVHAACPRCMSLLHEHENKHKHKNEYKNKQNMKINIKRYNAARPRYFSMLHVRFAWSILYAIAACPFPCSFFIVHYILHVHSAYQCCMSMSPCCMSILQIHAARQSCMSMQVIPPSCIMSQPAMTSRCIIQWQIVTRRYKMQQWNMTHRYMYNTAGGFYVKPWTWLAATLNSGAIWLAAVEFSAESWRAAI
jgi:hypothetical protein